MVRGRINCAITWEFNSRNQCRERSDELVVGRKMIKWKWGRLAVRAGEGEWGLLVSGFAGSSMSDRKRFARGGVAGLVLGLLGQTSWAESFSNFFCTESFSFFHFIFCFEI